MSADQQPTSPRSPHSSAAEQLPQLGRFRLLKKLGEGAQATVWLAHDPRLDREVALKVLRPGTDPGSVDEWLHEARAVSRLTHPFIVPIFEADTQGAQSYMVFEYVPGGTLVDLMRRQGKLDTRAAVELCMDVLDGLHAAHQAGVVHRDLKPSNIMIDAKGRARVMDFGIAGRVVASSGGAVSPAQRSERVVGTPGYLSPEAAAGMAPSPQMDVFAASILLVEMLSGRRLNYDPDPWRAVQRVQDEQFLVPGDLGADVDDALRAIIQRGLARDPEQRWLDAHLMHDALAEWLNPTEDAPAAGDAAGEGAALEFLLRRMRHQGDFPAMANAVSRIQRLTLSEKESLSSLSNEILKDVALTQKLLRLVNTVQYSQAGAGGITTISRAVALVGFGGIRNLALSLILLERMENKAHAQQLREEFLRSLMAASLARELSAGERDSEEAFLCAMFHNLGRSLTEFYFPEEARQIRRITRPERGPLLVKDAPAPVPEWIASARILGMSYDQLGIGVAKQWGLPESLQLSMRRPEGEPPLRQISHPDERQRWLAHAANDVADVILRTEPAQAHARVHAMAQRYARCLGVSAEAFGQAADQARLRLAQMTAVMDLALPQNSPALRLLAPLTPTPDDSLSALQLQATQVLESTAQLSQQQLIRDRAVETLAAGIQDVSNAMVENFKLNEVLRMILESIYRALGFRRVVFCLRDPKLDQLTGRFGLGQDVEGVVNCFKIALQPSAGRQADLFEAVCQRAVDTLIADAGASKIADRLPAWYCGPVAANSFLLLPLALRGKTFALIYADKAKTGGLDLGEKELSLLRTLRNQAVMAFKQTA